MAYFVSYIDMFVLLRKRRVFLQLWLFFIDKDNARAYVAVAGGGAGAAVVGGAARVRPCAEVIVRRG